MPTTTLNVRAESANGNANQSATDLDEEHGESRTFGAAFGITPGLPELIDAVLDELERRPAHAGEDAEREDLMLLNVLHNNRPWEFSDRQIRRMAELEHEAERQGWWHRRDWLKIIRGRIMVERPDRAVEVVNSPSAA